MTVEYHVSEGEGLLWSRRLSAVGSLLLLSNGIIGWLLLEVSILVTISLLEYFILGGKSLYEPLKIRTLISIVAPLSSMAAMTSPLLAVLAVLRNSKRLSSIQTPTEIITTTSPSVDRQATGESVPTTQSSPDHGLQTHLIAAFLFGSILGVSYGSKKGLMSVMLSSLFSVCVQCTSLAGIYSLQRAESLPFLRLRRSTEATRFLHLAKWTVFTVGMTSLVSLVYSVATFVLPTDTVLSPLYTLSNFLPYFATFATFGRDLKGYRMYHADLQSLKGAKCSASEASPVTAVPKTPDGGGPPGVDLRTLGVMQFNNILWTTYGVLVRDPAILISSIIGYIAAGAQLICFYLPVFEVSVKMTRCGLNAGTGGPCCFLLDAAWPFTKDTKTLGRAISNSPNTLEMVPCPTPAKETQQHFTLNGASKAAVESDEPSE